jgi:hypothetical protein
VKNSAVSNQGSLVIVFRFGFSVRPMHLFDYSQNPAERWAGGGSEVVVGVNAC